MRSAEISGVVGSGFGWLIHGWDEVMRSDMRRSSQRSPERSSNLSPVTFAVAITALSAAMLFVVTDVIRTIGETDGELQIVEAVMTEIGIGRVTPAALTNVPIAAKQLPLDLIDGGAFGGVLQRGTGAVRRGLPDDRRRLAPQAINPRLRRMTCSASSSSRSLLASVQEQQRVLARRYHEEKLKAEAANNSKIVVPRPPLPRHPHAAQPHHRLCRPDAARDLRSARRRALRELRRHHQRLGRAAARLLRLDPRARRVRERREGDAPGPLPGRRPPSNRRAPLSHAGDAGGHRHSSPALPPARRSAATASASSACSAT